MIIRFATALIAFGTVSAATAAPYCADMLDTDNLEKRYHYQAPIYNDDQTGWIIGSNQLDINHRINVQTFVLMGQIVSELNQLGTELAIMIAPPRPVVAGQDVVDATTGEPGLHDIRKQQMNYWHMVNQLRASGASVADLQQVALSDSRIRNSYYFQPRYPLDQYWCRT